MNNFDVIIIGGGIIGLSTAYKLVEGDPTLKICVLEKESETAFHQTGHNSGVIHSGIYYKPGSLKAENCIRGYKMLLGFCIENNIPYEICGKIIVAVNEKELKPLQLLYGRAIQNGLTGTKIISGKEIKEFEPDAAGIRGIVVPQTGIVDYKTVSGKIAELIKSKGVQIRLNEKVTNIKLSGSGAEVKTCNFLFNAKAVVSCAGLYSDKIASMINGKIDFRIIPFRGEYFKLKKSKRSLVRNLIYPVPDPEFPFLGVHFTRRMDGEVEAGPNAVLAFRKEGYKKSDFNFRELTDTLSYKGFHKIIKEYWKTGFYEAYRSISKKEFLRSLRRIIPEIKIDDLIPGGSGVRAQACDNEGRLIDDFLFIENERSVNVCNAPSPGATSCFAIGETISKKVLKKLNHNS
ncbi:MAG: L-2-hydroxyglutarate oxidase [Ignavibacteria bacterium]